MNNYPIWWDTDITVYNKFTDSQTQVVIWYRTVIKGCFWRNVGDKITINQTTLETNNIICRIPKNEHYREKYLWVKIPNDEMGKYFTLGSGDIIVKGEVLDEIDEYKSGKRSTDFLVKYKELQGVMQIQEVSDNTGDGRNNEHYFVKGV